MVFNSFMDNPRELEQVYNTETGKYNYILKEVLDQNKNPVIVKSTGEIKYKKIGQFDYTDKYQICYFSAGEGCLHCSHDNYCIFDEDRILLEEDYQIIKELKVLYDECLNVLNHIIRKDEIIYNNEFKEYYDIRLEKIIQDDCVHYKTHVKLVDKNKFIKAVESRIKSINKEVNYYTRSLAREQSQIKNK